MSVEMVVLHVQLKWSHYVHNNCTCTCTLCTCKYMYTLPNLQYMNTTVHVHALPFQDFQPICTQHMYTILNLQYMYITCTQPVAHHVHICTCTTNSTTHVYIIIQPINL